MSAIGFDLDGTLVTCEPRQSAVLKAAGGVEGVAIDVSRVWRRKREGMNTVEALRQTGIADADAARIGKRWIDMIELPAWQALDAPFADTRETLIRAQKAGHRLVLVTARQRTEWVKPQLKRLRLSDYFDSVEIVRGSRIAEDKAGILRAHQVTCFIGDTESDARAAAQASARFIGVTTGQRSAAFLQSRGVEECVQCLSLAADALISR